MNPQATKSFIILPELNLILASLHGKAQMGDLVNITLDFLKDPLYNSEYDLILDLKNSSFLSFRVDLYDFVEFFKKTVKLKKKIKFGIIIQTQNQEFLVNLYKPMAKLLNMEVEKHRSAELCLAWMEYEPQQKDSILYELEILRTQNQKRNPAI